MATQLIRPSWRAALSSRSTAIKLQTRQIMAGVAACLLVAYGAMFAGIHTAQQDRAAAERRYADSAQLLSVPAVPIATLQKDVAAAKQALAWSKGGATLSTIDPATDEATALLVTRARASSLNVTGITRLDRTQVRVKDILYDVEAIRISVEAASAGAVVLFLRDLHATDPGLVPTLSALTTGAGGGAAAELVFSVHTKVDAAAAAGAPAGASR